MSNISQWGYPHPPIYVLHIEDDEGVQRLMRRLLDRAFKATVVTVSSSDEAMAVVGSQKWDVVVSDWNINGPHSGGDVFQMVKAAYPLLASRYVFMSDAEEASELAKRELLPFVEKPADQAEICKAICLALDRGRL